MDLDMMYFEDTWITSHRVKGSIVLTTCWRAHHVRRAVLSPRMIMLGGNYFTLGWDKPLFNTCTSLCYRALDVGFPC